MEIFHSTNRGLFYHSTKLEKNTCAEYCGVILLVAAIFGSAGRDARANRRGEQTPLLKRGMNELGVRKRIK